MGVEGLSIFFPLTLFYFRRRKSAALDLLALTTALLTIFWLATSVQIRFLLPVFPLLSILAAFVLDDLIEGAKARVVRPFEEAHVHVLAREISHFVVCGLAHAQCTRAVGEHLALPRDRRALAAALEIDPVVRVIGKGGAVNRNS